MTRAAFPRSWRLDNPYVLCTEPRRLVDFIPCFPPTQASFPGGAHCPCPVVAPQALLQKVSPTLACAAPLVSSRRSSLGSAKEPKTGHRNEQFFCISNSPIGTIRFDPDRWTTVKYTYLTFLGRRSAAMAPVFHTSSLLLGNTRTLGIRMAHFETNSFDRRRAAARLRQNPPTSYQLLRESFPAERNRVSLKTRTAEAEQKSERHLGRSGMERGNRDIYTKRETNCQLAKTSTNSPRP